MTILYSMKTKVSNESNIVIQTLSTIFVDRCKFRFTNTKTYYQIVIFTV